MPGQSISQAAVQFCCGSRKGIREWIPVVQVARRPLFCQRIDNAKPIIPCLPDFLLGQRIKEWVAGLLGMLRR